MQYNNGNLHPVLCILYKRYIHRIGILELKIILRNDHVFIFLFGFSFYFISLYELTCAAMQIFSGPLALTSFFCMEKQFLR